MRVLIVSQFYRPEPVPLPGELAEGLVARGHEVVVITGWPNYPTGRVVGGFRRRLRTVELKGGVTVRRVPLHVSHSRSAFGRVLNYLSFAVSSLTASGIARRADVVYVYGTPMTAAFAPAVWTRLFRLPFVLHVQDLWPESVTGSGMIRGRVSRIAAAFLAPMLRATYALAERVVAIAPTMQQNLVQRGAPRERSSVVFNWASHLPAELPPRRPNTEGLSIAYAGNLGEMQDLETVLRAFAQVRALPGLKLTLFGEGTARRRLEQLAEELELDFVRFVGRLDETALEERLSGVDFLLVTLRDLDVFAGTIPSKFQAAIARGIPVITNVKGDVSDVVIRYGLGIAVQPADVGAFAGGIQLAYAMSGEERVKASQNARKYYMDHMAFDSGIQGLDRLLCDAAQSGVHA